VHSLFEAKGIAGNIVHAVATTNAIVAGLIVIEAIKVLQHDFHNLRSVLGFFRCPLSACSCCVFQIYIFFLSYQIEELAD